MLDRIRNKGEGKGKKKRGKERRREEEEEKRGEEEERVGQAWPARGDFRVTLFLEYRP